VAVQLQSTVVRFFSQILDQVQSVIAFLFNLLAFLGGRVAPLQMRAALYNKKG
jgi:hypothetical protein